MTPLKFKSLTDKSETLLATIRGSVLVHLQDGLLPSHLLGPLDLAGQLNELAAELGDKELAATADVLTTWLGLLVTEADQISDKRARSILDQVSAAEAAVLAFRNRSESATLNVNDFVDESFNELEARGRRQAPTLAPQSVDEFEIDSEMIEVFRDEADSLLQNIRSNLEILASRPGDRTALWEIQRSAHTFKGASGIVGLKLASELAHRIEDLLGSLSQNGDGSNTEIVPLLLNATACLGLLSDHGAGGETEKARFAEVCKAFDELTEKKTTDIGNRPENRRPADSTKTGPVSKPARGTIGKSRVVRISLDRLDDLVSYVRNLAAARSKFSKELENLGIQLKESRSNYNRLQRTAGKIDTLSDSGSATSGETHVVRFRQTAYELSETTQDTEVINDELAKVKRHLEDLTQRQQSLLQEMEDRLLRLRKVEFGTITTRLQRTVGVTCDEEGKKADLVIENSTTEIDTQLVDVLIEPLMHLLKNAIVHGIEAPEIRRMLGKRETGRIRVRIDNRGRDLMLKVSDDGRGIAFQPLLDKAVAAGIIAESEKDQLPNRRLHDLLFVPGLTTAERLTLNAGRGVGMSIVREAIAAAGGIVEYETSAQHGTTFTIIIPFVTDTPAAAPFAGSLNASSYAGAGARGTVVVVDDSPSVRLSTSRLLESAGWHIVVASNGLEALEKLHDMAEPPVAVVSDIEMPLMNGYDLLTEIRHDDALREIPMIFVSSRAENGEREKALGAGAEDYITKPFEDKKLVAVVDRLEAAREEAFVF